MADPLLYSNVSGSVKFRTLAAGAGITIVNSPTAITVSAAGDGGITVIVNEGGGAGVFDSIVGTTANLRTLVGTANGLTVTQGATTITVDNTLAGANLGAGAGVYSAKSGASLQFRSLVAGANISLTPAANDITIAASGVLTALANEGGGAGVFDAVVGTTANLRSLLGTANQVVVTQGATTITLSAPQDIATVSTPQFAGINIGSPAGKTDTKIVNITGTDASATAGPNVNFYTSDDQYPLVGVYPSAHSVVTITLDAYMDNAGALRSSSSVGSIIISKVANGLTINGFAATAGSLYANAFRHLYADTTSKQTIIETLGSDIQFLPFTATKVSSATGGGTVGTGGVSSNTVFGAGTAFTAAMLGGLLEVYISGSFRPSAIVRAVNSGSSLTVEPPLNIPNSSSYVLRYAPAGGANPFTGISRGYVGIIGATVTGLTASAAVMTDANKNLTATTTPTFSSLTLSAAADQLVLGSGNTTTITAPAPGAPRTYTLPDFGSAASFVLTDNVTYKTMTRGVYTPTIGALGTDFTTTTAFGTWQITGAVIQWSARLVWTAKNAASGEIRIGALPNFSWAVADYRGAVAVGSFEGLTYGVQVVGEMLGNQNWVTLVEVDNAGGAATVLVDTAYAAAGSLTISGSYLIGPPV